MPRLLKGREGLPGEEGERVCPEAEVAGVRVEELRLATDQFSGQAAGAGAVEYRRPSRRITDLIRSRAGEPDSGLAGAGPVPETVLAGGVVEGGLEDGPVSYLDAAYETDADGRLSDEEEIESEFKKQHTLICKRIDQYFAWLMLAQWIAAVAIAVWVSPQTWDGDRSSLHPHVSLALLYGGLLTLLPVMLTRIAPGKKGTRLTVAATQMMMSSLLIHLTGGRIETHFHIFGSLAFLAYYLDWEVLLTASAVILVDHVLRGLFLPFSMFGTYVVQPWRWAEHVGWVVFCDVFLMLACRGRLKAMRESAAKDVERGRLLHRAHFDGLTGLPNRSYLTERITEMICEARRKADANADPAYVEAVVEVGAGSGAGSGVGRTGKASQRIAGFGILYIDLDRFKDVNDVFGHTSGDAVLRLVAHRMKARMDGDAFLARLGGDEFVAIIEAPAAQPNRPEEVARAILRSLRHPFKLLGEEFVLGASIGLSHYPQDGEDEVELLMKSDRAMYRVKRAGRNDCLVYSDSLSADSSERDAAELDLKRALTEGELEPWYQPIYFANGSGQLANGARTPVGMGKDALAGLEMLLRWPHPKRGNLPPSYFIPLAEETGLIVQIGQFILHEACKSATDWRNRGLLPGRIAVNVSSLELAREDFAEGVMRTLLQHYTPPDAIELEVTETALVNDFVLAERQLKELRAFGIKVSIDDFGTGYSSLSRLRQLTLDTLKIDRLFVEGVATSEADSTVVEHIIAMAHTLGMTVVAEGVETQEQLEALRRLDCDEIQGYLMARPMNRVNTEVFLNDEQLIKALAISREVNAGLDSPGEFAIG